MKALDLMLLDKNISENCIFEAYFLTVLPICATNWNHLKDFGIIPLKDYTCVI